MNKIRIGMMGFGQVGRQVYRLALDDDRYEVVAVSDIGRPEILHHLLTKSMGSRLPVRLESNYLVRHDGGNGGGAAHRTRLLPADKPAEIPWDVFGADLVVDSFGIVEGVINTVHAYTNDQSLADVPHSDWRRSRAAAENIIPTSTGAAKAVQAAADSPRMKNVLEFTREPVVSSDIIGNPHSSIYDASFTQVTG